MRFRPLVALLAAALAAALAASSPLGAKVGPRLDRATYSARVTAIVRGADRQIARAQIHDPASLRRARAALASAAERLAALRPPADATARHRALVRSLRDYSIQVSFIHASLRSDNLATLMLYVRLATGWQGANRAIRALNAADYAIRARVADLPF